MPSFDPVRVSGDFMEGERGGEGADEIGFDDHKTKIRRLPSRRMENDPLVVTSVFSLL